MGSHSGPYGRYNPDDWCNWNQFPKLPIIKIVIKARNRIESLHSCGLQHLESTASGMGKGDLLD